MKKIFSCLLGSTPFVTSVRTHLSILLLTGTILGAQDTSSPEVDDDDIIELDPVVVTGSYIPTLIDQNFASPVTTIDSEDIEDTGLGANLLEVLRKSTPQFSGSQNLGSSNANFSYASTGGGSRIALRNTNTLVLINGRRAAFSPISGRGSTPFVDLNLIPVSAVERVEILKDGASATYGSDATGGVVNVILKSDFEGLEVSGRYGVSPNDGNWEERRLDFTTGISGKNWRLTVAGEWSKTDPLWQYERDFSKTTYNSGSFYTPGFVFDGTTGASYILAPGLAAPPVDADLTPQEAVDQGFYVPIADYRDLLTGNGPGGQYAFNFSDYVTTLLSTERKSLLASFELDLNNDLTFFADGLYSNSETFSQIAGTIIRTGDFGIPGDHPYNPFSSVFYPISRNVDYPRSYNYDTESFRITGGLRGKLTDAIQFESAANYNRVSQDFRNPGVVDKTLLSSLMGENPAAGPGDTPAFNIFARTNPPEAILPAVGTATSQFDSTLTTLDARIFGDLFELSSGMIQFALGTEFRIEDLDGNADPKSVPDPNGSFAWEDSAASIRPFSRDREIFSIFAELEIPVISETADIPGIHSLDLKLAGRHERYSDTSDPTVPKVSLIWQPVDDTLAIRCTYSESFNAPALYDLYGPSSTGFTDTISLIPSGQSTSSTWGSANFRGGSNPDLDPSESESITAGIVWNPKFIKGLSVEIDYFQIKEDNRVEVVPAGVIAQDVEINGLDSPYASKLRIGSFDGSPVTAPGQVFPANPSSIYIVGVADNFAAQEISGVDLDIAYAVEINESTQLHLSTLWAWIESFDVQILPTDKAVDTSGQATLLSGTLPEWRGYSTVTLQYKRMDFMVGHNFISSMDYEMAPAGREMDAYSTFDLAFAYRFSTGLADGLNLRIGVNNVTDEMPPLAPELFGEANADVSTYDPVGRLFYIETKYRF